MLGQVFDLQVGMVVDFEVENLPSAQEGFLPVRLCCVNLGGAKCFHAEAGETVHRADIENRLTGQIDVLEQIHGAEQRGVLRLPRRKTSACGEIAKIDRVKPFLTRKLIFKRFVTHGEPPKKLNLNLTGRAVYYGDEACATATRIDKA
ncbi:hypothetical protein A7A08_02702 [Methyloligella halotolerans]|uniref:Uncharacterized protein n=1 Tax=Methyloligella halotolerans TaxID=1177755 RepID=A0A1E2RVQ0_9HYPH|nr:hypothetical protein [Methyloligella halotolerans]ODA66304.1 hypothetical protein A7A08_02702 [Methyloligella halotolerans]